MNKLAFELLEKLLSAQLGDEINRLIEQIAEIGEPAVEPLLWYIKNRAPVRSSHFWAMPILQKIGYPDNRAAIGFMVDLASDINASHWEAALDELVEIGEPALSAIRNAIHYYASDLEENSLAIQGITILLAKMGSPLIDHLLTDLLWLLEMGTDNNWADLYVLLPLRKIGSPKADIALNAIEKVITSKRNKIVRKESIEALADFDRAVTRRFIPMLKDSLDDPEEEIRQSAQDALRAMGETGGEC